MEVGDGKKQRKHYGGENYENKQEHEHICNFWKKGNNINKEDSRNCNRKNQAENIEVLTISDDDDSSKKEFLDLSKDCVIIDDNDRNGVNIYKQCKNFKYSYESRRINDGNNDRDASICSQDEKARQNIKFSDNLYRKNANLLHGNFHEKDEDRENSEYRNRGFGCNSEGKETSFMNSETQKCDVTDLSEYLDIEDDLLLCSAQNALFEDSTSSASILFSCRAQSSFSSSISFLSCSSTSSQSTSEVLSPQTTPSKILFVPETSGFSNSLVKLKSPEKNPEEKLHTGRKSHSQVACEHDISDAGRAALEREARFRVASIFPSLTLSSNETSSVLSTDVTLHQKSEVLSNIPNAKDTSAARLFVPAHVYTPTKIFPVRGEITDEENYEHKNIVPSDYCGQRHLPCHTVSSEAINDRYRDCNILHHSQPKDYFLVQDISSEDYMFPDLQELFILFDRLYFDTKLASVEVRWSSRMTLCAGLCICQRGGYCSIRLSEPLLKYRSVKEFKETLLHEMIHAYLFVTSRKRQHYSHGSDFISHMTRINSVSGLNISVYHHFHSEVDYYRTHIWRCQGQCKHFPPFYGYVRRTMNRAPGPHDRWWPKHEKTCGGKFVKITNSERKKNKKL